MGDHFTTRDGVRCAGLHVLLDLWGAQHLSDASYVARALRDAAEAAGATILHSNAHHFSEGGGVSCVLVLAESHIAIHTWPEANLATIDIYMCGSCDPRLCVPILLRAFTPERYEQNNMHRGIVPHTT